MKPDYILANPDGSFQALRTGEFPNTRTGPDGVVQHFLQVVEAQDLARVVQVWEAEGRPELRIDADHLSYNAGQPSASLGWVQDLTVQDDRLVPRARWSSEGIKLLEGGVYRKCSAVIQCADEPGQPAGAGQTRENPIRTRPVRLDSVALTNVPNIPGLQLLSNRAPDGDYGRPTNPTQPTKKMELAALAALLGLPPETVTAEAITAAITTLLEDAKASADSKKETVEADLDEFKNCIPAAQVDFFRTNLLANRQTTLTVLKGIQTAAADPARLHNRQQAGPVATPVITTAGKLTEQEKDAKQKVAITALMNSNRHLSESAAFDLARAANPDIFTV